MAGRREDGSAVAEKHSEENGAFDPGLETGYLRRAPRDHELDIEQGAAPFEPGPGAGYDGKRAKRAQKRREKAEQKLQEQRERAAQQRLEEERAAAIKAMHEREQRERDRARREHERLQRSRELHEQNLQAQEEQLERRRHERAAIQAERQRQAEERREHERAERERIERERKERARELKAQELERLAERERQEREEMLRAKREESLRKERERAERIHTRRRQMVEQAAPADGQAAPVKPIAAREEKASAKVVAVPQAEKTAPATVKPVPRHSLKWPTLKLGLALAAISAAAFGAGTLLGLPLPDLSSESAGSKTSSLAGALALDSGTPASLTKGPFHPVLATVDYGERDARFGAPRSGHIHEGQDMFAKTGTALVSVRDGVVVDRGKVNGAYSGGRGNYLAIYSPLDDVSFVYLHMLRPAPVLIGDEVRAGEQIGQLGCTGTCFGPHLHFEVRQGKASLRADTKAVDPLPYLRQWPQAAAANTP